MMLTRCSDEWFKYLGYCRRRAEIDLSILRTDFHNHMGSGLMRSDYRCSKETDGGPGQLPSGWLWLFPRCKLVYGDGNRTTSQCGSSQCEDLAGQVGSLHVGHGQPPVSSSAILRLYTSLSSGEQDRPLVGPTEMIAWQKAVEVAKSHTKPGGWLEGQGQDI